MDNSDKIWQLIARALNDEATSLEREELMEILSKDEFLQQQYDLLARIWAEKHENFRHEDMETARNSVSRIISKAETESTIVELLPPKRRFRRRRIWLSAASIAAIGLAGWMWAANYSAANKEGKKEIIEAQKGSRSSSMLPDGSTVWLNAGSKLYFEKSDFSGAIRQVRLEGEAFFDVVKDPEHPFFVHTSGIDIKVLGTTFNVKAYPDDDSVETTLFKGSVQVFRQQETEQKPIQLRPNQKLILPRQAANQANNLSEQIKPTTTKGKPASFIIAHIDSTKKENERFETAWFYGRLEFRGNNFAELAKKLERWYNVTIVFTDEKVKELSFDGSFEKETVEQAFRSLKIANSFEYKINDHEISVGSAR